MENLQSSKEEEKASMTFLSNFHSEKDTQCDYSISVHFTLSLFVIKSCQLLALISRQSCLLEKDEVNFCLGFTKIDCISDQSTGRPALAFN